MRSVIVGAWFLFSLNGDGSLGPMMAAFSNEEACVAASYRIALARGQETRCLGDYTLRMQIDPAADVAGTSVAAW